MRVGTLKHKQLSLQGEELTKLSAEELKGLLTYKKNKTDIFGGKGGLINSANTTIVKYNKRYKKEILAGIMPKMESFKMPKAPSKKNPKSKQEYTRELQNLYMKIQNFLTSEKSDFKKLDEERNVAYNDLKRKLEEKLGIDEENQKAKYQKEGTKDYYDEDLPAPDALIDESRKYFDILVDRLKNNTTISSSGSDVYEAARMTTETHPLLTETYTFNELLKEAESNLRQLVETKHSKGKAMANKVYSRR